MLWIRSRVGGRGWVERRGSVRRSCESRVVGREDSVDM